MLLSLQKLFQIFIYSFSLSLTRSLTHFFYFLIFLCAFHSFLLLFSVEELMNLILPLCRCDENEGRRNERKTLQRLENKHLFKNIFLFFSFSTARSKLNIEGGGKISRFSCFVLELFFFSSNKMNEIAACDAE